MTIPEATSALSISPPWPTIVPQTRTSYTSGGFVVQVAQDIRAFPQWPSLGDTDGAAKSHVFQRREHLDVWLETVGAGCNVIPFFVSVSDRTGEQLMLLPLGVEKKYGLRILKFLDGGVADYNAQVLFPMASALQEKDAAALWKSICRAIGPFDIARLEKMPEEVEGIKNPLHPFNRERWYISGHYLTLAGLQRQQLNPKESRRKLRRLSEHGEVSFGIVTKESEIKPIFDAFLRQKSRRYMETLGRPGFDAPSQVAYYLTLTRRLLRGGAQLAYLKVNGEVIATAWNLIAGTRLYYMMASYEDGKWSKHSPGWLLLEDMVTRSSRNGIEIFDFGIGDEAYKLKWQETELPLWSAVLPNSLLGWAWLAVEKVLKDAKKALPRRMVAFLKACHPRSRKRLRQRSNIGLPRMP